MSESEKPLCAYGCGQTAQHQLKNGTWSCSPHRSSCPAIRRIIQGAVRKNWEIREKSQLFQKLPPHENPGVCEYGCGQESKHQLGNGKWCCSPYVAQCPEMRKKNSEGSRRSSTQGKVAWNKGGTSWSKGKTVEANPELANSLGQGMKSLHAKLSSGELKRDASWASSKEYWTPERRKAKSEEKKRLFQEHPEKHPNRLVAGNSQNWTYPEKRTAAWLNAHSIVFEKNKRILDYYPDFTINDIIIELDGEYWHDKAKDAIRDAEIVTQGYTIFRIPASEPIEARLEQIFDPAYTTTEKYQKFAVELARSQEEREQKKAIELVCPECGSKKGKEATKCFKCACKDNGLVGRKVKNRPSKEELEKLVQEHPMTELGKMFGISDNAVKAWCKSYQIHLENRRGYWQKKKSGSPIQLELPL